MRLHHRPRRRYEEEELVGVFTERFEEEGEYRGDGDRSEELEPALAELRLKIKFLENSIERLNSLTVVQEVKPAPKDKNHERGLEEVIETKARKMAS
ncbi:MAG: hypothetical protein ACM3SW_14290 [Actinomycetota bacterium]